ncbi:MAG TPA: tyrosine-protein phosphatase [Gemmatales bacterium]|nr:tyrosine-protein phosphatase [Gemmatales bacterium]
MLYVKKHWRTLFSILLLVWVIFSISAYARFQNRNLRNFLVVDPGVLYRSGQLSAKGLAKILYEHNIGTVINLRGNSQGQQNASVIMEEEVCFKNFVQHVTLPLGSTEQRAQATAEEAHALVDKAAQQFLQILSDPITYPRPILVHCLAGIHRTGVMAALYRMEIQGWSKEHALAEMKALGYDNFVQYDPVRDYVVHWSPTPKKK